MISKSIKIVIEAKWRNCFFSVQKEKRLQKVAVVIYICTQYTYGRAYLLTVSDGLQYVSGQGTENDTEWTGFLQCFVSEVEPLLECSLCQLHFYLLYLVEVCFNGALGVSRT